MSKPLPTPEHLGAFEQQVLDLLDPLIQTGLLNTNTVQWSERTEHGVITSTVNVSASGVVSADTKPGSSVMPEKLLDAASVKATEHEITYPARSLGGRLSVTMRSKGTNHAARTFHVSPGDLHGEPVLHLTALVMTVLNERRRSAAPDLPTPLFVQLNSTEHHATSGQDLDWRTVLNFSPRRDPEMLEYRESNRMRPKLNWYTPYQLLIPLDLEDEVTIATQAATPVIPSEAQNRAFEEEYQLLEDFVRRSTDPRISVVFSHPLTDPLFDSHHEFQGSVLSYTQRKIEHRTLQTRQKHDLNEAWQKAVQEAEDTTPATREVITLQGSHAHLQAGNHTVPLHGDLCLLLAHATVHWTAGSRTMLEWHHEEREERMRFIPLDREQAHVTYWNQKQNTRETALLDLNASLRPLTETNRCYQHNDLARP